MQSFIAGELNTSQKQAVIKLIEKKDRDKRSIKNWRPISLLNVDMKLMSKVLAIVEIEPKPVDLDFKNLSQYSSRCK